MGRSTTRPRPFEGEGGAAHWTAPPSIATIARPRIARTDEPRPLHALRRRPPQLRPRFDPPPHARRGPRLLRPSHGHALRELQRRHVAHPPRATPALRQH